MSCEVTKDKFYFFKKAKLLLITKQDIFWIYKNRKTLKRRDSIKNLAGITKSLLIKSDNFVVHMITRYDEELYCD